jgi:hypothetical protein
MLARARFVYHLLALFRDILLYLQSDVLQKLAQNAEYQTQIADVARLKLSCAHIIGAETVRRAVNEMLRFLDDEPLLREHTQHVLGSHLHSTAKRWGREAVRLIQEVQLPTRDGIPHFDSPTRVASSPENPVLRTVGVQAELDVVMAANAVETLKLLAARTQRMAATEEALITTVALEGAITAARERVLKAKRERAAAEATLIEQLEVTALHE